MNARVRRVIDAATSEAKPLRKWWRRKGKYIFRIPVRMGDLARNLPFSDEFGFDRGGAIDRIYIEEFLDAKRGFIRGHVLEIGDDAYTRQFGGSQVTAADIFHVDETNPRATWVGDISDAPHVPSDTYDCIVLTQTLHLVWDVRAAIATLHRILRPGGRLILTSPGITQLDRGEWSKTWYWSFTDRSMRRLLGETFGEGSVEITNYGNVYAATTFLFGLGAPEIDRKLLVPNDERYPVIVAAVAQKAT